MSEPRVKSEIRVSAILRRAHGAGAFAAVVRRGDPDAGAIAIKIYMGAQLARLFVEARDEEGAPIWREPFDAAAAEGDIDGWLEKEKRFDSDLWIVEIEDRDGRAFLA